MTSEGWMKKKLYSSRNQGGRTENREMHFIFTANIAYQIINQFGGENPIPI